MSLILKDESSQNNFDLTHILKFYVCKLLLRFEEVKYSFKYTILCIPDHSRKMHIVTVLLAYSLFSAQLYSQIIVRKMINKKAIAFLSIYIV